MDYQDEIYRKAEALVRPILESNAKRFARQLDMTYAEALQEARYGLALALREYNYNASKGGIFNFVKTSVRRHFLKAWAVHGTQGRRPHVQVTDDEGKRTSLPVPFVEPPVRAQGDFMDSFESVLLAPDAMLIESEASVTTSAFQTALENALSDRDRDVLRCKCDPPRGLRMLMLDDLLDEPTIPLIGRYLGLSKNEVDWALRRIREAAIALMGRDFSDLTELSIVRAYVERRP